MSPGQTGHITGQMGRVPGDRRDAHKGVSRQNSLRLFVFSFPNGTFNMTGSLGYVCRSLGKGGGGHGPDSVHSVEHGGGIVPICIDASCAKAPERMQAKLLLSSHGMSLRQ